MSQFPSGEYELIDIIRSLAGENFNSAYEVKIGDDAAVRRCSGDERLVMTADISVENVHFSLDYMTIEEAGYKAMVSNLSDCAAMGAVPDGAIIQLVFPKNTPDLTSKVKSLYKGFSEACSRWEFPLIGGDLSGGSVWTIAITLLGRVDKGRRVLTRRGIKTGDRLWVSGVPGRSAAGLEALKRWGRESFPRRYESFLNAHIRPAPGVELGLQLASLSSVHALMDLSDGLSKDVATLSYENGLGFLFETIDLQKLTLMVELAKELGKEWKEWFFHGGEDYELLFAAQESFDPSSLPGSDLEFISLGRFSDKYKGLAVQCEGGRVEPLGLGSWDHVDGS